MLALDAKTSLPPAAVRFGQLQHPLKADTAVISCSWAADVGPDKARSQQLLAETCPGGLILESRAPAFNFWAHPARMNCVGLLPRSPSHSWAASCCNLIFPVRTPRLALYVLQYFSSCTAAMFDRFDPADPDEYPAGGALS